MTTIMKNRLRNDVAIERAVEDELAWIPEVDPSEIGVSAVNGIVTLRGRIATHAERVAAVDAARRTVGVIDVHDELSVDYVGAGRDLEIADAVRHALDLTVAVPPSAVFVEVHEGVVTLTGTLAWHFERVGAERAAENVPGVRAVVDRIQLSSRASAADAQERIAKALERNAQIDARRVHVSVEDNIATLTGTVQSYAEKRQAALATWCSPHVNEVRNQITVSPTW